ncbi:MAG: DUF1957 domain-containing protein [Candidatus Schekmanbacteria bacterium]|nr:DUF1957 domain-containing protein [Candidatus Schekmanbacteria bacterium]
MEEKGYLMLVLHAHLPYVRHPEHEEFLEEDWFFEGVTETYIPLIHVFEGLVRDGVDFRMTMSLSPTLVSMFVDPLLQSRYLRHLESLIELSEKEIQRTKKSDPNFQYLAQMYHQNFLKVRETFVDKYNYNLVNAFKKFQDAGFLEIITCGATHGFFPLMMVQPQAVRVQIQTAVEHYTQHFGRTPRGIWLPECGYTPGVDDLLKEAGIKFFFVDTHGVQYAEPRPKYSNFAPIICPSGVAAFGRDQESSKQVWSSEEGYPGDFNYREFYRDIGFDLDFDYIKPYIHKDGIRINTSIKYYRITGKTNHKEPYNPQWAAEKAAEHAGNFMFNRERQVEHLYGAMGEKPLVVAPYDAELFGHWWYEGPEWINMLFRKTCYDQNVYRTITPSEYLERYPNRQVCSPSLSSWGYKGYCEVWLEGSNDWVYRHLHKAAERMTELAHTYPQADGLLERALKQAARELLLAQSSDWAFIMKTGTVVEYAVKRTKTHLWRFNKLYADIKQNQIVEEWLWDVESKDNLFPDINYRLYAS